MKTLILDKLVKVIWPWIKKYVWPILQKKIVESIPEIFDWFMQKVKDLFNSNNKKREDEAFSKSKAAEEKSKNAENQFEADKWKREAEIWKEVAEQYKADNSFLKDEISKIQNDAKKEIKDEIDNMDPDIEVKSGKAVLKINGISTDLPSLE